MQLQCTRMIQPFDPILASDLQHRRIQLTGRDVDNVQRDTDLSFQLGVHPNSVPYDLRATS